MKLSYSEQLRHPNWQRVRLERLGAANWTCQCCSDKGTTLHVHHKRYVKGRMAWEYGEDDLVVLCEPCHAGAHETRDAFLQVLCYVEANPKAGVTERDLLSLITSYLMTAAGGVDAEALYDFDFSENQRSHLIAHAAACAFNSDLSDYNLSDLPILFSDTYLPQLQALIQQAQADVRAEVDADLASSRASKEVASDKKG